MASESKENYASQKSFVWDVSCSQPVVNYSNNMKTASVVKGDHYRIVRGPFWNSGRHIVNIRINKLNSSSGGFGIGIMDKTFKSCANKYLGAVKGSSSYYYSGDAYKDGAGIGTKFDGYKDGDIITVDVDFEKHALNFAKNSDYLTVKDTIIFSSDSVAVAVNMYYDEDSCTIMQHYTV